MARKKKRDEEMERSQAEAIALLESWAGERRRVLLLIRAAWIVVEGYLHRLDGQEPNFWFKSLSGDLTKSLILDPPIRVEASEAGAFIRFGVDDDQRCSLRLSPVQKADPAQLGEVMTQLKDWANRQTKVMVEFDFGFAGSGHFCEVEVTPNPDIFGLVECETNQLHVLTPSLCVHAALESREGYANPFVILRSDSGSPVVRIVEGRVGSGRTEGLAMLSKMVQ
ncbi:MAG: hypothetical protein WB622_14465 [Acidobacteriaceae bacterium]